MADVGKKICKILFLIIIWSVIIEIFSFWYNNLAGKENFWLCLYYGKYLNYLWFLKSLIVVYIVFPIIYLSFKFANDNFNIDIYALVLSAIAFGNNFLTMLANIIMYFRDGSLFRINTEYNFITPFLPDMAGGYFRFPIVYFILGGHFTKKYTN